MTTATDGNSCCFVVHTFDATSSHSPTRSHNETIEINSNFFLRPQAGLSTEAIVDYIHDLGLTGKK
ncbi:hypothetical protein AGR9A_Lc40180 [Agrobacterium salinitolerans str. Hayward 0363]|nr:hypothetical protein AGR9A_Lc40180 [Agrobacterium salinitolerans str. Hayward 0363]